MTPSPTEPDALNDAYQAGQRQARLEARVDNHEQRIQTNEKKLDAINGSIDRGAEHTRELGTKFDRFLAEQDTAKAVQQALRESVQESNRLSKEANDRQVSSRGFFLATATVVITLLGVIFAVLIGVHLI